MNTKSGLRHFAKSPAFTALVVLMLTLGAGTDALMFSVINSVLFRPLPYPDGDRLVEVDSVLPGGESTSVSWLNYQDIRDQNHSLSDVAAYAVQNSFLELGNIDNTRVLSVGVTSNLLSVVGVQPSLGRTFSPGDDQLNKPCFVVLSDKLWNTRFAADRTVIGRNVRIDKQDCSITGVMPRGFGFPVGNDAGLWTALHPNISSRGTSYLTVLGKLKPGISAAHARTEMNVLASRLAAAYPKENQGLGLAIRPYRDVVTGDVSTALWALLGAVILLQVIICANIGNMQLARAVGRRREIAIRMAIGAGKARIAQQLLTENLLLALVSGTAGIALAYGGLSLVRSLAAGVLPRVNEIHLDLGVCFVLFAAVTVVAVVAGFFPLVQAREGNLERDLRENSKSVSGGRGQTWLRDVLVVGQIGLAVVLLFGSALLLRSLLRLMGQDLGFNTAQVLTLRTSVSGERYAQSNIANALYLPQLERIRQLPNVRSAALVTFLPLSLGHISAAFNIAGRPTPDPEHPRKAALNAASEDYFRTLSIPLLKGRVFTASDGLGSQRVAVINDSLARRYFGNEDPVGRQLTFGDPDFIAHPLNIVGVVHGSRQQSMGEPSEPEIYFSVRQVTPGSLWSTILLQNVMTYVVRTDSNPHAQLSPVRGAINSIDSSQTLFDVGTMDEIVSNFVQDRRLGLILLGVFAVLALLIAAVGLYAMLSYNVQQRTNEIALRMVLGAPRASVLNLILHRAFLIDMIGIGIGIAGALTIGKLLSHLLYGVQPWDPITLAIACAVLLPITLPAALIPAVRASSVNMLVGLRIE